MTDCRADVGTLRSTYVQAVGLKSPYFFCSHIFASSDTNGDGKMIFVEWRNSVLHNLTEVQLMDQWHKCDTINVEYLRTRLSISGSQGVLVTHSDRACYFISCAFLDLLPA